MQLQKEMKSNLAVKMCAALKKAIVKKDMKSKVAAKTCDGRLIRQIWSSEENTNSPEFLIFFFCH